MLHKVESFAIHIRSIHWTLANNIRDLYCDLRQLTVIPWHIAVHYDPNYVLTSRLSMQHCIT